MDRDESREVTEEDEKEQLSSTKLVLLRIETGCELQIDCCSKRAFLIQYLRRVNISKPDLEAHDFQSQVPYSQPSLSTFLL